MLDFMRRQRSSLKWVLIAVIFTLAASMVISLVPYLGDVKSGTLTNDVARVGSETVSATEFQTAYNNYLRNMQQRQQLSPEILKAFGFDRQVLDFLIGQKVILAEAKRLGLEVTSEELAERIMSNASFQAGGTFIGRERYEAMLLQAETTPDRFESNLREQLTAFKVQSLVTAGVTVSEKEAELAYRNRNEKAQLTYFVIDPVKLESKVATPSDQELKTYYDKNAAKYNVPEKRKSKYAFVDMVKIRAELKADDDELRTFYGEHAEEYRLPEQITAQHILFKTEGKTPEQIEMIRKKATDVLGRAKKGEDFSKLAKEVSEDESASRGGTLGTFGRGTKSPQFEQAAFILGAGAISDVVTTPEGFHIIKVTERQESRLRTFDELKEAIRPRLLFDKAREKAKTVAEQIALDAVTSKDLNAAATKNGAIVRETGLIEQSAAIPDLGSTSTDYQTKAFSMAKDQYGTAMEVQNGYAVAQVVEIEAGHPASFEEARTKATADAKAEKAREQATELTNKVRQQIESGKGDLAAIAQSVAGEVKTSMKLIRGSSIQEYGPLNERDQEIFSLPLGKVAPPSTFNSRTLVFAVKSRDEINPEEMKKALPTMREDMLPEKKEKYFTAYIQELQKKMQDAGSISVNESAMAQIASTVAEDRADASGDRPSWTAGGAMLLEGRCTRWPKAGVVFRFQRPLHPDNIRQLFNRRRGLVQRRALFVRQRDLHNLLDSVGAKFHGHADVEPVDPVLAF
jgi:peptidyl-prolyl cis-trans isomerase D